MTDHCTIPHSASTVASADDPTHRDDEIARYLSTAQAQLNHASSYIGYGLYTAQQWELLAKTLERLGELAPAARKRSRSQG